MNFSLVDFSGYKKNAKKTVFDRVWMIVRTLLFYFLYKFVQSSLDFWLKIVHKNK